MTPNRISIAWAYGFLVLLFLALTAWLPREQHEVRLPKLAMARSPEQTLGGLVPSGLWQLDAAKLHSSIDRLPGVRIGRELGNSLRIAAGQRVEWIEWGGRAPEMLFPTIDLWVSRGINPDVADRLDRAAKIISDYDRKLAAEGWLLVVLPVPTKLSVHRDLAHWPMQGADLLSRDPIDRDRSDEVYGYLQRALEERDVHAVNLLARYRASLAANPEQLLFATNDSHWSGTGIRLAAIATADEVASATALQRKTPVRPTYLSVAHVGDLAKAFDPAPWWTSWLKPVWVFQDRLINGEQGQGYVYAAHPRGLLVGIGTSYTGQYTWIENQPVGLTWQIGLRLHEVEIQNRPVAGQGSFVAFGNFLREKDALEAEFAARAGPTAPRVVIWEFPLRDIEGIASLSKAPAH